MRLSNWNCARKLLLGVLFLIGMSSLATAELTVIYDSGQTEPIAPLMNPVMRRADSQTPPADSKTSDLPSTHSLGSALLSNLLPVRSPALTVGDSNRIQLSREVLARLVQVNPRPFFLIGSDPLSLRWLTTHRETLRTLGAVGLLVQAETESDVRQVSAAAKGIPMTLASGEDLAKALGIHHYPVLITRDGIRQ